MPLFVLNIKLNLFLQLSYDKADSMIDKTKLLLQSW